MSSQVVAKKLCSQAACDLIEEGQVVGLGSGSTVGCFIEHLGKKCQDGFNIQAVASSKESENLANQAGIPLIDINACQKVDIAFDGADEIDPEKRMIKGGGGAHLREKILAALADELVIIVDSTKLVDFLGKFPLPVEISAFGWPSTIKLLEKQGYKGFLRKGDNDKVFVTENGNYILDLQLPHPCELPENDNEIIRNIPGVLSTGFFFNLAGRVIVGHPTGEIEIFT